jgi:uncharacterized metal-binding protein
MCGQSECCGPQTNVLLYACSGGANVAEVADRAARQLMSEGLGTMFCLAGLGGRHTGHGPDRQGCGDEPGHRRLPC